MQKPITAKDYMTGVRLTFTKDMDVLEAIRLLLQKQVTGAPVVDKVGNLIGMLTEKDCMQVALKAGYHEEWGGPVSEFMHTGVVTVDADTNIVNVAELLDECEHRTCPVLYESRLVGQITRRDILRALDTLSHETR
jgi:predicted transcriptional regulator